MDTRSVEDLCVIGSGLIASQIAAMRATTDPVLVCARSTSSAQRVANAILKVGERLGDSFSPARVSVAAGLDAVAACSFLIEAVTEDLDTKVPLLREAGHRAAPETILATTTSSLSIQRLAQASGRPERFVGFHVFNPVPRMPLVELVYPENALASTRLRAQELVAALGKRSIIAPDAPGFVVNRLLFPFLFDAVELMEKYEMSAVDVDDAVKLGLSHVIGPLALLDLIGLDVAHNIAASLKLKTPRSLTILVDAGQLGRKTGVGFYNYE